MNTVQSESLPFGHDDKLAAMFAALAHPARIRILRHLAGQEACNCKQVVGEVKLAQSTVSQHLKILVEAGLVLYRPQQQRSCYSVAPHTIEILAGNMSRLAQECCVCAPPETSRSAPNGE